MTSIVRYLALMLLLVGTGFVARSQSADSDRRLYDDPAIWDQLSSAKQNLLIAKFGRKQPATVPSDKSDKAGDAQYLFHAPGGGNELRAIVNTLVNNAVADATSQDTQSETAIVLGSGSNILSSFNDSGSYLSNNHFTGFARSTDGGTTWTDGGILPNSTTGDAGDPVLARSNATGTIFLATLGFTNSNVLQMFRSTDNGATYLAPVNSTPGFTTTTGNHDKEWIAVDNFAGSGNGNVYQFWRNFGTPGGMTFTRSTDDGATWTPSGGLTLASGGQGAWVAVGPDHAVYCFWLSGTSIVLKKSTDQGVSFGSTTTAATLSTTGTNGDLALGGGFRTNAFPQVVISPTTGNLFMVYNDKSGADKANVYFRQSSNGGTTWSAQVKVNDDAGTNDQWQPAFAITPDGTSLGIGWYDRRNDPSNSLIERWGVTATVSGSTVTFGSNFRVSPQFSVVVGVDPVINTTYMGDYDQMAADNSYYYIQWADNRDQSIAVPSRKNANVRFAKIPVTGPPPLAAMSLSATSLTGGNGNGFVDPNECNNFTITLRNDGTATATNVVGTLTTTAPNITLTTHTGNYPNINVGSTATSAVPFTISSNLSYACGTVIPLKLVVTYTGGSDTIAINAPINGGSYSLTQSTGNSIVSGTTDIGNHGDDDVTNIALPFSYDFYDQTFSSVNASSNGNLQFTSSSNAYLNACFPTSTLNYSISPFWDDQRTDSVGRGIFTSTSGSAPNRIFNIEFRATLYSGGASVNYEVRLYEGQKKFDIIYGTLGNAGTSATVGIQKGTGSDYMQFGCNAGGLSSGLKLTYANIACADGGGDCIPLPVQLAGFTGVHTGNATVLLEWRTISEINNFGFDVERGETQAGPFVTIPGSFQPGHGTTLEPQRYRWTDVAALMTQPYYRLKQIDLDGSVNYSDPIYVGIATGVEEKGIPAAFALSQNYPNPFNPTTIISYALPKNTHVRCELYNSVGQMVRVLADAEQEAGYHNVTLDGSNLASGVYIYKLTAGTFSAARKLVLMK